MRPDFKLQTPREELRVPIYPATRVARYVGALAGTVRTWFDGRAAHAELPHRGAILPRAGTGRLSFIEMVEAHVLLTLKKGFKLPPKNVRRAMEYLRESNIPLEALAHKNLRADRTHLYLAIKDAMLSLSEGGQYVEHAIIEDGLSRLEFGSDGFASSYAPNFGPHEDLIILTPFQNGGRPTLRHIGVAADAISDRYLAGETVHDLAKDYGVKSDEILAAINWCEHFGIAA